MLGICYEFLISVVTVGFELQTSPSHWNEIVVETIVRGTIKI